MGGKIEQREIRGQLRGIRCSLSSQPPIFLSVKQNAIYGR